MDFIIPSNPVKDVRLVLVVLLVLETYRISKKHQNQFLIDTQLTSVLERKISKK